jgi:Mn2+/Fe2+ NRAMP family transporter
MQTTPTPSISTRDDLSKSRISKPPLNLKEFLKWLGPAFIFTAAQIGGGEFITVPLLGAYLGFSGLYLIPIIAFIKIFGQYYLVQYGIVTGKTFLQTSWDKKWLRWMFFALMIGCILHSMLLAGLLGQTAGTLNFLIPIPINIWIIIIVGAGFGIVFTKSYKLLEKTSSILLWIFIGLISIVAILFWPSLEEWLIGFTPSLPGSVKGLETTSSAETIAVLFVVLGSGFGPTISYIWFAKDKKMGMFELPEGKQIKPENLTQEERSRLKGWKKVILYQNLVSATILTLFSLMIWIASAQTLHQKFFKPEGWDLIPQMVSIFTEIYGGWSGFLFILCGGIALFSSILGPLYGFSRLWEESFERLGIYKRFQVNRMTIYRICLFIFTLLPSIFILFIGKPMLLFSIASMLTGPILGLVFIFPIIVLHREMKNTAPQLKPTRYWAIFLAIISGILIIVLSLLGLG